MLCDKVGVDDLFESSEIEEEEWLHIQVCLSVKVMAFELAVVIEQYSDNGQGKIENT